MKRFLILVLAATLTAAPPPKKKKPDAALMGRIDKLLDEGDAARAHWGVLAVDAKDGHVIYSRSEHRLFAPASNTKLFTTATALETLGPGYRFHTTVEARGDDLVLVGRGDPNLSPRVLPYKDKAEFVGAPTIALDHLADAVAATGIKSVEGNIVGDDTYFLYERYGDGWTIDDSLWSYGAPVSALTINDNTMMLRVAPGDSPGDMARLSLDPFGAYFTLENRVRTIASGPRRIHIDRQPGSRQFEVWGTIPAGDAGTHENVAMDDPAELAARYFKDALEKRGITVKGQAKARHLRAMDELVAAAPAPVVASIDSAPLSEDLKVINKVSQNLHAEMLLRTVGHGSVAAGLAAVKDFLHTVGVPDKEFAFYDGCGLSRGNLVSPAVTTGLLRYMNASKNRDTWLDTLPVGGADGTLDNRLKATCTINQVQAKTGTLRHVSAISGYITTSHGSRVVFSIMVNNYNTPAHDATTVMDRVLDEICRN